MCELVRHSWNIRNSTGKVGPVYVEYWLDIDNYVGTNFTSFPCSIDQIFKTQGLIVQNLWGKKFKFSYKY